MNATVFIPLTGGGGGAWAEPFKWGVDSKFVYNIRSLPDVFQYIYTPG